MGRKRKSSKGHGAKHAYTSEDREILEQMHAAGATDLAIAKRLGRTVGAIHTQRWKLENPTYIEKRKRIRMGAKKKSQPGVRIGEEKQLTLAQLVIDSNLAGPDKLELLQGLL